MGMYDTVYFRCPKCGVDIEEQSKSGLQAMGDYAASEVPVEVARGIVGGTVYCPGCNTKYKVVEVPPDTSTVRLGLVSEEGGW